jgi:hypothetical protein
MRNFFVPSPKFFRSRKSKSCSATDLVMSLTVNCKEHLLGAQAKTRLSNDILLETYTLEQLNTNVTVTKPP